MKLRFTPRARADIADIHQYIAQHNTTAAAAVVRQICETSQLLSRHPGLGRETDISGVRVLPTARYPYVVYHRVLGDQLIVIHVRHGRRDMPEEHEL